MKRIITFLLIIAMFSNIAMAEHTISIDNSNSGMTISILDLEVYTWDEDFTDDPWNTYANLGDTITIGYTVCNWESTTQQYYADLIIIDESGNGELMNSFGVVTVEPGECLPDYQFEYTVPSTPGTYTIEAITSYYPSGLEDDTDKFYLHVSSVPDISDEEREDEEQEDEGSTNNPPIISVIESKEGFIYSYDASGSTDSDGSIVQYNWSVDGTAAGSTNKFSIDVSKFDIGVHTILLIITDNDGGVSSYTQTLTVKSSETDQPVITTGESETAEGSILETEKGIAKFVINIAGEPYYIPGFDSCIALCGLLAVFVLVRRERLD